MCAHYCQIIDIILALAIFRLLSAIFLEIFLDEICRDLGGYHRRE
ncbi:unnamed protein product [Acidithrix sp. C25]|nr:unnamed protein product [Acidithrix sp. C25]